MLLLRGLYESVVLFFLLGWFPDTGFDSLDSSCEHGLWNEVAPGVFVLGWEFLPGKILPVGLEHVEVEEDVFVDPVDFSVERGLAGERSPMNHARIPPDVEHGKVTDEFISAEEHGISGL